MKEGKVFGLFATDALAHELDRDPVREPSLAEMTGKAIELLSGDEDGFFLMAEGSKIDWAAHANDPVGLVSDISAFDDAVKVAVDFAKLDGGTAVLIMSDHGNGGISLGDESTTKSYDRTVPEDFLAVLKKAGCTGEGLQRKLDPDMDDAALRTISWIKDSRKNNFAFSYPGLGQSSAGSQSRNPLRSAAAPAVSLNRAN